MASTLFTFATTIILYLQFHLTRCSFLHDRSSTTAQKIFKRGRGILSNNNLRQEDDAYEKTVEIVIPQHYSSSESPMYKSLYPSPLHSIYIFPLMSTAQAEKCLHLSKQYAARTQCWSKGKSDRHQSYATVDFAVEDCEELEDYLYDIGFQTKIFSFISAKYGISELDMFFLDFFCARYEVIKPVDSDRYEDRSAFSMDRLPPHRDGSLISFTVALTPPSQYGGGGTFFDGLRDVQEHPNHDHFLREGGIVRGKNAGDTVIHSGKALHGAHPVHLGERIVLVGFVDVEECCMRPGVLAEACKNWGRMDVAADRLKRQNQMTALDDSNDALHNLKTEEDKVARGGWIIRNTRYLPQRRWREERSKSGQNCLKLFSPALSSVRLRGNMDYQRQKKLEAEDILLRDVVLPQEARNNDESYLGDVAIY